MFSHAQSLLIQTQKDFWVFYVFLESILFLQNWKFQKQCCSVLATQSRVIQVACHSRELASQSWQLVHECKVQLQGVHRDFCGSAHDSFASETSSHKKHLANFSKLLAWSVLAGVLATDWRLVSVVKNRCFAFQRQFLKLFQFFPRIFVTVHCLPHFSLSNTPCLTSKSIHLLHHLILRSSRKRYRFSLSHLIFHVLIIIFLIFKLSLWFEIYYVGNFFFCLD